MFQAWESQPWLMNVWMCASHYICQYKINVFVKCIHAILGAVECLVLLWIRHDYTVHDSPSFMYFSNCKKYSEFSVVNLSGCKPFGKAYQVYIIILLIIIIITCLFMPCDLIIYIMTD